MPIYKKSPKALLLDKINQANLVPIPLTDTNCKLDKPTAIELTKDGFNTSIVVRGIQYRGYIGSVTFRYFRLDLATLFKNTPLVADAPGLTQLAGAVNNINARYGLNLQSTDVVDVPLVDGQVFTLAAAPTCLQYIGQVNGRYLNAGNRLGDVIYNRSLDTYNHPITATDVSQGYKSGGMLGYGIDFTDEANIIDGLVDGPMGTGVNFTSGASEALLQTMVGLGFPAWDFTSARIDHYGQGIVAKANPRYEKVAVISDIADNNIRGPIYLHYNLR